jgi:hypothetical protein
MLEEEEEGVSQEELLEINRKLDDMYAFYDLTNRQDIQACEMVQDGVRVRDYQGGRMAFQFEETIHRFQNMVADYVRREKKPQRSEEKSVLRIVTPFISRVHSSFLRASLLLLPNILSPPSSSFLLLPPPFSSFLLLPPPFSSFLLLPPRFLLLPPPSSFLLVSLLASPPVRSPVLHGSPRVTDARPLASASTEPRPS